MHMHNVQYAYIIFQIGVEDFEIRAQNILIFGQGCSTPLTEPASYTVQ